MSHAWLTAMGIDVPHAQGEGERTLLGHRLLCILRTGPQSKRDPSRLDRESTWE